MTTHAKPLTLSPLLLRLCLGITMLWAGLGKIIPTMPVQGEQAAMLAQLGVIERPVTETPQGPEPTAAEFPGERQVRRVHGITLLLAQSAESHTPTPEAGAETAPEPSTTVPTPAHDETPDAPVVEPTAGAGTSTPLVTRLWPRFLSEGRWPVYGAWAAALTETIGGALVLVGLLTRLSGFTLACVMGTAMWLTQIGPAMMSGDAALGFLPNHGAWDIANGQAAFATLFWQFSLFSIALALLFMGAGKASIDRALFAPAVDEAHHPRSARRAPQHDDEDDEDEEE
ncbi:MAG: DoxX family membrane protein [Phycisphaerales bacterium]